MTNKVPVSYYVTSVIALAGLIALATIPSAMVFHVRFFEIPGLRTWQQEILRWAFLGALPGAVGVSFLIRIFSCSSTEHAKTLKNAFHLEIFAAGAEIAAAVIVPGADSLLAVIQGVLLIAAVCSAFYALGTSVTASDFYKMVIQEHEGLTNRGGQTSFSSDVRRPPLAPRE